MSRSYFRNRTERLRRRNYALYVYRDENGRWRAGPLTSSQPTGSFISKQKVRRIKSKVAHANRVRAIQRRHLEVTGDYLSYRRAQAKLRQLIRQKQSDEYAFRDYFGDY